MAGERLKVPGYTEVSAVCTHPEHTGHGYARILMTEVMQRIRSAGKRRFCTFGKITCVRLSCIKGWGLANGCCCTWLCCERFSFN